VDKPGSPQTTLIAFGLGVAAQYAGLCGDHEMNSILGGLFSSRINMNLREKNGYTYGAFSGFTFYRERRTVLLRCAGADGCDGSGGEGAFLRADRIHTDPATPEELKLAKDSALRSLPGDFETVGSETGLMAELFVYGLPNDYFQKLPARLRR
jgi:zinc protease